MRVKLIGHLQQAYPPRLRRRLLEVMAPAATRTEELCALHAAVGDCFAETAARAVQELFGDRRRPEVIGSHGQTICHLPPRRAAGTSRSFVGATLQIGDPARIARRTRVTTVADFRQADIAAAGQGAPLVPWTDHVLFTNAKRCRAIQNIGGIANVTYLPAAGRPDDVIAFDSGPGNMVIDEFVRHFTKGRRQFDDGGRRARRGRVVEPVLRAWVRHPFLRRRPPKTAGREEFGRTFVQQALRSADASTVRPDDWIATATALTAQSIADAYRRFLPTRGRQPVLDELIVTGGGARNATLLGMLADALPAIAIQPIDEFGIPDAAKEAVSFAMLALACLDRVPANLPRVTGAQGPVILGAITPAP
jgi:anhydro-N-acetylmuramic acid kinase